MRQNNALILIEEVENGLHPVAVRLFVQYLQRAALRKRLQVIFTTHSQEAVNEMPDFAVWACINSQIWNGKLSIESLRAVTGQIPNERVVFVEDGFAQELVSNAIGRYASQLVETTSVFAAGGYPSVVTVTKYHNQNPSIKIPAKALVDGDIYDPTTCEKLPEYAHFLEGGVPEATVFEYVYNNRQALSGIIQQRCHLSAFSQERIVEEIEAVRNSACDPHVIYTSIGERLNFSSELIIRRGLIDIYNERNPDMWAKTMEFLKR